MTTSSSNQRLYAEQEYVEPQLYAPSTIDAVAAYLRKQTGDKELPTIGIVRHVLSDPETGLRRLFQSRSPQKPDDEIRRRVLRHMPRIKECIEQALQQKQPTPDQTPEATEIYHGPEPIETLDFPEADTKFAASIQRMWEHVSTQDNPERLLDAIEHFTDWIEGEYTPPHPDIHPALMEKARARIQETIPGNFLNGLRAFLNAHWLMDQGIYLETVTNGENATNDSITTSIRSVQRYATAGQPVSLLRTTRCGESFCNIKSPFYDSLTDHAVVQSEWPLIEAYTAAEVGMGGKEWKQFSRGSHLTRKTYTPHYKAMWERYADKSFGVAVRNMMCGSGSDPHAYLTKFSGHPLIQAIESSAITEEMRHAIDYRALNVEPDTSPHAPLRISRLYLENGRIHHLLTSLPLPPTQDESSMIQSAGLEVLGKMTALGVCIDPHLELDHFWHVLEQARLASRVRYRTFQDDLLEARKPNRDKNDNGHTLAVKMITVMLGHQSGLIQNKPLELVEQTYDLYELADVLKQLKKAKKRELRLLSKHATDPEFVLPVDSLPFGTIDERGLLERQ